VEELDVQAVLDQPHRLRDPVMLFEAKNESVPGVVGRFDLVDPKDEWET
jgi:hypothetical protein